MPILFFLQLNYRRPIFLSKWQWGDANTNSFRAPIKVPGHPCVVLLSRARPGSHTACVGTALTTRT